MFKSSVVKLSPIETPLKTLIVSLLTLSLPIILKSLIISEYKLVMLKLKRK